MKETSKVGIIYNGPIKPIGGPSGYLYNLKDSLDYNNLKNISLLTPEAFETPLNSKKDFLKKNSPYILLLAIKFIIYYKFYLSIKSKVEKQEILHFHSTTDLYFLSYFINLKKYKIVLTSHSPEPFCNEVREIAKASGFSSNKIEQMYRFQKKFDIFSFSTANYLVFPCEGAVDPYRQFFKQYGIDFSKIRYVLTSSQPLTPKLSRDEFLTKYNIDKNKFIIAYIGRKNSIKGFDLFISIYENSTDNSLFFISAGTGPIEPRSSINYLDIGWTNDPGSVVNSADLVIIPNRDTYFDIGMIQALSLNKKVLTTLTGGNKWFESKSESIFFFDPNDINSALEVLNKISKATVDSNDNIRIYKDFLANEKFAINFNSFYENLNT